MAVTLVSSVIVEDDPVTSASRNIASVQAGDVITVAYARGLGDEPTSVTSDLDGNFTLQFTYTSNVRIGIYKLVAATAGTHNVTISYGGAADTIVAFFDLWRGMSSTADATSTGTSGDTVTAIDHGSCSISGAGVIITIAGLGGGSSGLAPASGFTEAEAPGIRGYRQYKITTGSETPSNTATSTGSVSYDGRAVSYLATAGGAAARAFRHYHRRRT